jgi:hypothetical protein
LHDIGNRLNVPDPELVNLHASVLLQRYVAMRPNDVGSMTLLETAPACLFLTIKCQCTVGGRALKDFFEVRRIQ